MSQPVFKQRLEEDIVQRVGTKLGLEVLVEESSEKVFFEWRGPSGSNADDGRVRITEAGSVSTLEISPVHLQVIVPGGTRPVFTLFLMTGPGSVDLLG